MEYIEGLKKALHFAYQIATKEAKCQAQHSKKRYGLRVCDTGIVPGDLVTVRNVGLKDKCKLAYHWRKDIFVVKEQHSIDLYLSEKSRGQG